MKSLTRRNFLKMVTALPATVAWPQWMPRLAFAPPHTAPRGDLLVCVFLRGAADGLSMIVPHGDEQYYQMRPTLAIPRPDDRRSQVGLRSRDLDGFFGLHPALAPLLPLWQAGQFARMTTGCGTRGGASGLSRSPPARSWARPSKSFATQTSSVTAKR